MHPDLLRGPLALLLLVALALAPAPARGQAAAAVSAVGELRVCGESAHDAGNQECSRDQRSVPIRGPLVVCTARAPSLPGAPYVGRLFYEGKPFPAFRGTVRSNGAMAVGYAIPALLPAGRWHCELTVGADTVRAAFRTGGGRAAVNAPAACRSVEAIQVSGQRIFCESDRSAQPLARAGGISCSATFARVRGRRLAIELLREGRSTSLEFGTRTELPVVALGTRFFAAAGQPFPEGDYACRFSIAGRPRAVVGFRLVARVPPLSPRQQFVRQGTALCDDFYAQVRRLLGTVDESTGAGLLASFRGMYRIGVANTRRLGALRPPEPLAASFARALALQRTADAYVGSLVRQLAALEPSARRAAADRQGARYNRIVTAPDPWYRKAGLPACVSG
jgi:hypothetical protein